MFTEYRLVIYNFHTNTGTLLRVYSKQRGMTPHANLNLTHRRAKKLTRRNIANLPPYARVKDLYAIQNLQNKKQQTTRIATRINFLCISV